MFRISGIRFFPISGTWRNWQRWSRCREVARGAGSGWFTVKDLYCSLWKTSTVLSTRLFLKKTLTFDYQALGLAKASKLQGRNTSQVKYPTKGMKLNLVKNRACLGWGWMVAVPHLWNWTARQTLWREIRSSLPSLKRYKLYTFQYFITPHLLQSIALWQHF